MLEFDDDSGGEPGASKLTFAALSSGRADVRIEELGGNYAAFTGYDISVSLGCATDLVLGNQTITGVHPFQATTTAILGPALVTNGTDISVESPVVSFASGAEVGGVFRAGNSPVCP